MTYFSFNSWLLLIFLLFTVFKSLGRFFLIHFYYPSLLPPLTKFELSQRKSKLPPSCLPRSTLLLGNSVHLLTLIDMHPSHKRILCYFTMNRALTLLYLNIGSLIDIVGSTIFGNRLEFVFACCRLVLWWMDFVNGLAGLVFSCWVKVLTT